MSIHVNPFQYGGVVADEAFCNRGEELAALRRAAENGERLLVYAERRMGKTSLVRRVLAELPSRSFIPIYVDVWATSDEVTLAKAVAAATVRAVATRADRVLDAARDLVRLLYPTVSVDDAGNPVVQFGARPGEPAAPVLEDALDAPARLAASRGRRVVVAYDEIQRLGEYGSDTAERLLRSRTQEHEGVAYLFMGSRRHLIREMFMDRGRPLYQAAGHFPIGPIATEHWVPFLVEGFHAAGKRLDVSIVTELCARTDGHPYYTQHLAHALWEITPRGEEATRVRLDEAESLVLTRLGYPFTVMWEGMTANQRVLVRNLATSGTGAEVFSAPSLRSLGMAPSSAARAIEGLIASDVLDRDEAGYVLTDRFFRLWVRRLDPG